MTITVLTTPNRPRRYCTGEMDSHGRLFIYNPSFLNGIADYDTSVTGVPERYDPGSGAWTTLAQSSERVQVVYGFAMDASDRFMRVGGQILNAGTAVRTMEIYDPSSNTWSFGGSLPSGTERIRNAGWMDASGTFWAGGGIKLSTGTNLSDFYKYVSGAWVAVTSAPATFGWNSLPAMASLIDSTGRFYFLNDPGGSSGALQRYTPSTDAWSTLTSCPAGAPTTYAMGADQIYALVSASTTGLLRRWDIASGAWSTLASLPTPGAGAIVYHPTLNALFAFSSLRLVAGSFVTDSNIYKYDIAADTWSTTGDALSAFRITTPPVFDGAGYYILQGSSTNNLAVNVVEYFLPAGAGGGGVTLRKRGFAAVIG